MDPHNNSGSLSGTKATVHLQTTTSTIGHQKCTSASLFATNNSVKFTVLGNRSNGSKILIQQYKSGKWKTIKTVKPGTSSATIKNLKQNTTYKFRLVGYVSASNGKKAITGAPTKTLTFKTGYSKKTAVKSVTCTGAKTSYVKKQWHSGHWSGGTWYDGFYTDGYCRIIRRKKKSLSQRWNDFANWKGV